MSPDYIRETIRRNGGVKSAWGSKSLEPDSERLHVLMGNGFYLDMYGYEASRAVEIVFEEMRVNANPLL